MKRHQPQTQNLAAIAKTLANAISSLFFSDNNREFQRLKNFIAS